MKINPTKLIFCLYFFVFLSSGLKLCGSTSDPRVGKMPSEEDLKQVTFSNKPHDFDNNELVIIDNKTTKRYSQIARIKENTIPVLLSTEEGPKYWKAVDKKNILFLMPRGQAETEAKQLGKPASEQNITKAQEQLAWSPDKRMLQPGAIVLVKEAQDTYIYGKIWDGIVAIIEEKDAFLFFDPTRQRLGKFPTKESKLPSETFSLTAWSTEWFTVYKEYSDQIDKAQEAYPTNPALTWEQFKTTAQAFIEKHRTTDLGQKKSWFEGKALSPDFFDVEKYDYNWANGLLLMDDYKEAFVQKLIIDSGSTVFFIGDFHGSLHSLLRILWHFVAAGVLNDSLEIIKKNNYIIFNGDLVDRGRYSIEVLFTILQLKLHNWDKVFILRGNHEEASISQRDGLLDELMAKYTVANPHQFVAKIFEFFPMALYLGSGKDKAFVQCCHGGIEVGYNPENFLAAPREITFQKLGDADEKHVTKLDPILVTKNRDNHAGFNWSDFIQEYDGRIWSNFERATGVRGEEGPGYVADVEATFKYLGVNTSIKAFFRGHQDFGHVFKMLFGSNLGKTIEDKCKVDQAKLDTIKARETKIGRRGYPDGPYNWHDVLTPQEEKEMNQDGFLIHKYVPVFTFTTATEARGLAHDSYGKLTTADTYDKWRLKPYESELAKEWHDAFEKEWRDEKAQHFETPEESEEELEDAMTDELEDEKYRNGKYVQLVYKKNPADEHLSVSVKYSTDPVENPIPEELASAEINVVERPQEEIKEEIKVEVKKPIKREIGRKIGEEASPEDIRKISFDKNNVFEKNEIVIIKPGNIYAKIIAGEKANTVYHVVWGGDAFYPTAKIGKVDPAKLIKRTTGEVAKEEAQYDKDNSFDTNETVIIKHKDKDTGKIREIYAKIIKIDKAGIFNRVIWRDGRYLTEKIGKIKK